MDTAMVVNLFTTLNADNLNIQYAYSDTKVSNTSSLTFKTNFEGQKIETRKTRYIYIQASVIDTSKSATFFTTLTWTYGYPLLVTYSVNGTQYTGYNVLNAQMNEPPTPEVADGSTFEGWYLDSAYTQPATFPMESSNSTLSLYAKIEIAPNLPSDWLAYSTKTYYVKKGTSTLPADLVIPKTYNDGTNGEANVTYIYSASSASSGVFYGKTGLTSVTIPNTITSIGKYAFYKCSSLTSITIPSSVTSIGDYAFNGCSSLTSIVVETGNTVYDSRNNCNAIIKTSTNTLIQGCSATVIPSGVTSIGYAAFSYCSSLTSITIPSGVTSIGEYAFQYCTSLTSITIPSSVTSIGYYAFSSCSVLTRVTFEGGSQLTSIGEWAFSWCYGLTSITIPSSVTSIGNYAFQVCTSLTSITIPSSVTSIGQYAFNGCSKLTSITFSDTSTWYRTTNSTDWTNKTGGTVTSVTNASTNATNFTSTYYNYYWYKL